MFSSCASIPFFKASEPIQYKEYKINESNSFLPREYREVLDSSFTQEDYIDRKLKINFPDSIPDTSLYNSDAPIFKPYPNDSGIVLSEKDMALYITDRANVTFLKTELKSRKKVHADIIKGAIEAEKLYRGTIQESNKYNKEIYNAYKEEKRSKDTWRNISLFVISFGGGFILNQYVVNR